MIAPLASSVGYHTVPWVNSVAPTPQEGLFWCDNVTRSIQIFDSGAWQTYTGGAGTVEGLVVGSDVAPGAPVVGQIWTDQTGALFVWSGTVWVQH
jgi:hypothetical protein